MKKNRMTIRSILGLLSITTLMCIMIVPRLKVQFAGGSLRAISAVLIAVWALDVMCTFLRQHTMNRREMAMLFFVFAAALLVFFNAYNFRGAAVPVLLPFCPMLMLSYYGYNFEEQRLQTRIAAVYLVAFVSTFLSTLAVFAYSPYIIRDIAHESFADQSVYMRLNVGNTGHIYVSSLVVVTCIAKRRYLFSAKIHVKIIAAFVFLTAFSLLIGGSSGISLLCCVIGIVLTTLLQGTDKKKIVMILLLTVAGSLFITIADELLMLISENIDNVFIAKKMADIASSLASGTAAGDVASRTNEYASDLDIFVRSCGLGVGSQYRQAFPEAEINGHSDIFSNMARYGVFWLIFLMMAIRCVYGALVRIHGGKDETDTPVLITYLIMMFLQPVLSSIETTVYMFCVFPYVNLLLAGQKKDKNYG